MTVEQPAGPDDAAARALRLRASDADRDRVAGIVRDAYAEGRLTPVEMEERLQEAMAAQTYGDLLPVLRDLPVPPGAVPIPGAAVVPAASSGAASLPADAPEGPLTAIFGEFNRSGRWRVPAATNATCIFGGGKIDYTQATFTGREGVLTVAVIMGGLEITVPAGVAVRNEAVAILGGSQMPPSIDDPLAPVLVIRGVVIMGGVEVTRKG